MKLSNLKKRTSFLVAECFQNVVRHSTKDIESGPDSKLNESFFLRFYENRCFIASENLIHKAQVENLKSKLDQVNQYNKDELKVLYRSILEEGEFSNEGGAGLGLVEMARKTGNKLLYSFDHFDHDFSLFYLMIVLENKEIEGPEAEYEKDLDVLKQVIKNVQQDNIFVLYKGDFGKEIVSHIEHILEGNLDSQPDSLATKVKLYNAALMIMHKIGQYSIIDNKKQAGMLFFAREEKSYMINATFPVSKEDKILIDGILKELFKAGPDELEKIYHNKLELSAKEKSNQPGLVFSQLVLISKSWGYEFASPQNLPEELVFQVNI
jgi:hypothetical protein